MDDDFVIVEDDRFAAPVLEPDIPLVGLASLFVEAIRAKDFAPMPVGGEGPRRSAIDRVLGIDQPIVVRQSAGTRELPGEGCVAWLPPGRR